MIYKNNEGLFIELKDNNCFFNGDLCKNYEKIDNNILSICLNDDYAFTVKLNGELFQIYKDESEKCCRTKFDITNSSKIAKAVYGSDTKYTDVTNIIKNIKNNIIVTNDLFGCDPHPGIIKKLKIYYEDKEYVVEEYSALTNETYYIKPNAIKTKNKLLFATSYITQLTINRYKNWHNYYKKIFGNEYDLLLINDGKIDINVPNEWNIITFDTHLGNIGSYHFQGWIRSFVRGIQYAVDNDYENIIHIESDCFMRDTYANKFNELVKQNRYISSWTKFNFMETAIQIIPKDTANTILNYFSDENNYKSSTLFEDVFFKEFKPSIAIQSHRIECDNMSEYRNIQNINFFCQADYDGHRRLFETSEPENFNIINKKKIAVIKSIVGDIEQLHDPKIVFNTCDYYAYVSNKINSKVWKQYDFINYIDTGKYKNRINSRYPKILSNLLLKDYDYFIWLDAANDLIVNPLEIIDKYLDKYDAAFFKHPYRNCIYKEAQEIIISGYDSKEIIMKQVDFYKKENFPENYGLFENSAFIRRNNDEFNKLSNLWWKQLLQYSSRDQMSFMYCLWKLKNNIKINILPGSARSPEGNNNILRQTKLHITAK